MDAPVRLGGPHHAPGPGCLRGVDSPNTHERSPRSSQMTRTSGAAYGTTLFAQYPATWRQNPVQGEEVTTKYLSVQYARKSTSDSWEMIASNSVPVPRTRPRRLPGHAARARAQKMGRHGRVGSNSSCIRTPASRKPNICLVISRSDKNRWDACTIQSPLLSTVINSDEPRAEGAAN